jgi:hypothetical protein
MSPRPAGGLSQHHSPESLPSRPCDRHNLNFDGWGKTGYRQGKSRFYGHAQRENMNSKCLTLIVLAASPLSAFAQAGQTAKGHSLGMNLLVSLTPVIIIGVIIFFTFRFGLKNQRKKSDPIIARHQQHMDRVEHLLDRIAKALEEEKPAPPKISN